MKTSNAPVHEPRDLDHALALRAAHPDAMPLAGCTDVMVAIETRAIDPPAFLNLWGLDELRGITRDDALWIGALATYTELVESADVNAWAPVVVEAARTCGAWQIQNRGTLGGNIANASPAGDSLPVLLACDAQIELASAARGRRLVPLAQLYTGYRALAMAPDELITRIRLPQPHAADRTYYRKVGTRLAQAISKVVLGGRLRVEGGIVIEARVALGSVAPTPVRCPSVEAALVGQPIDPAAADHVDADIAPIDDVRSTADYRRSVARRVVRGWLRSEQRATSLT